MTESPSRYSSRYDSSHSHRTNWVNEEVKKRSLPELSIENDSMNLRIVYPKTLYVVGVGKELNSPEALRRYENLGQYGSILDVNVKESNYREPNNKFIIQFDKDYQAALAFKGITLQKARNNYSVRAYFSKNKFCYHFIRGEECRKKNCSLIHDKPDSAHYFVENKINTTLYDDKMSTDIIENNLEEIHSKYFSAPDSFKHASKNPLFLSVQEIIRKLGFGGILPDSTPVNWTVTEDKQREPSSSGEDSLDLKNFAFEYNDTFYVNEDQEIQKNVERYNKRGFENCQETGDTSSENMPGFEEIIKRNKDFLDNAQSEGNDSGFSHGPDLTFEEQSSEESVQPAAWQMRRRWFFEPQEDLVVRDVASKVSSTAVFDIIMNNMLGSIDFNISRLYFEAGARGQEARPEPLDRQPKPATPMKKPEPPKRIDKELYLYKLDEARTKLIQERTKALKSASASKHETPAPTAPADPHPDRQPVEEAPDFKPPQPPQPQQPPNPSEPTANPSTANTHSMENVESSGWLDHREEVLIFEADQPRLEETAAPKPALSKKPKKRQGNFLIEADQEQSLFGPPKQKKNKNKKNQKVQQKAVLVQKKAQNFDGVSEINCKEESFNDEGDFGEIGELMDHYPNGQSQSQMLAVDDEGIKAFNSEVLASLEGGKLAKAAQNKDSHSDQDNGNSDGEGKEKKKRKKKPKKPAPAVSSPQKEVEVEQVIIPDREKDLAVTKIDEFLRNNDNISAILGVLAEEPIGEEVYVDKKRLYTKIVLVSDTSAKGGK